MGVTADYLILSSAPAVFHQPAYITPYLSSCVVRSLLELPRVIACSCSPRVFSCFPLSSLCRAGVLFPAPLWILHADHHSSRRGIRHAGHHSPAVCILGLECFFLIKRAFTCILHPRIFHVTGEVSKVHQLVTGVPQDSVLGPLLFTIYTI